MKLLFIIASLFFVTEEGSVKADDVVGIWLSGTGKAHIQIFKQGNEYYGKIIWMNEPNEANGKPKVDKNNPDIQNSTKPVLGLMIIRSFQFEKDEWTNGKIYDPENGKEYKCNMKLKNANTLNVRGYIGISLLGRTETWTRIK
jgi:uncharacterized protein (DUF2147 family)